MGFNTTVLILNDALGYIEADAEFGKNLARAIHSVACSDRGADVGSGGHCNAARVIETHHADHYRPVLIGANHGIVLDSFVPYRNDDPELAALRAMAKKRGYSLRRMPDR